MFFGTLDEGLRLQETIAFTGKRRCERTPVGDGVGQDLPSLVGLASAYLPGAAVRQKCVGNTPGS